MSHKKPYGTLARRVRQDSVVVGHGIFRIIGEQNLEFVQWQASQTGLTEVAICNNLVNDAIRQARENKKTISSYFGDISSLYYVYQLREVDSHVPFYIGAGRGERMASHRKVAEKGLSHVAVKIAELNKHNAEFTEEILFMSPDERLCLEVELCFINMYGRRCKKEGPLVNKRNYIVQRQIKHKI